MKDELMPREKALEYGITSLNNNELLALIVKSGYKNINVFDLVEEIIERSNGFYNLLSLSYEELIDIKGIKKAKALEILAILEIAKRLAKPQVVKEDAMLSPGKLVSWLRYNLGYLTHEEFFVVYLNRRSTIIKYESLFKGSKNSSIVAVDEVFRKAIILKASSILIAHNHPSGKCNPSFQDIDITNKLKQASLMLGIPLLDHIIISNSEYYSFKNNKLL